MTRALVTGACGQDGYYLCKHLLSLDYQVVGVTRRRKIDSEDMVAGVRYEVGDVQDASCVHDLLVHEKPDMVFNLAAEAFVPSSWGASWLVFQINTQGALNFLDAIVRTGLKTKFYQAGSSEMFGDSPPSQDEQTAMRPLSPYAASKVAAFNLVRMYREAHNLFACNGILFNHESPRRLPCFVTRSITQQVAAIAEGRATKIEIGNIDAIRDWGHARDYVRAMHLMLQESGSGDYVIATGQSRTVKDLVDLAFSVIGKRAIIGENVIETQERHRRNDKLVLRGDAVKARTVLGWKPEITFEAMIEEMITHDRQEIREQMARQDALSR